MKFLQIIIPVKNEQDNIQSLIERIDKTLKDADFSYNLVVIDDNSTDSTAEILEKLSKTYSIKTFKKEGKPGKAYSILEGIKKCTSENLAMIDGDGQYPPEIIPEMFELLEKHGVVIAKRAEVKTSPLRKLASRSFKYIFGKLLLNLNYDIQSGLKLFKKEILENVDQSEVSAWTLDIPMLLTAKELGYSITEVPITFEQRQKGISKVNVPKVAFELGSQTLKTRFRKQRIYPIASSDQKTMQGAGVIYKKRRYITHTTLNPEQSAIKTFTLGQKIFFFALLGVIGAGLLLNFLFTLQLLIGVLSVIYFADVLFTFYLVYKSLNNPPEIVTTPEQLAALDDKALPIYTILCPLYKESHVLPGFLDAISKLDWPKEKLDVCLLLEEDDTESIDYCDKADLPSYVRVLVVPDSQPKTKPKACNYGLSKALGEYLVIFDAEDVPDPLQLKKAYLAFQTAPANVVCLQAKLNYFNPHQNLLTRLFASEYSLWFDVTLTGLQSIETTIPLGGTSNHFKVKDLIALSGWDPFNVTEDCDLGVRLVHAGFRTAIIESTTLEEANSNLKNWIRQRSRWIKGYMQTYMIHMRNPIDLARKQGWHFLVFQLVVGGKIGFIFINPFLWLLTIAYFALRSIVGPSIEALYPSAIFYIAVSSLVLGNFLFMYYYMIGVAKREQWSLMKYVFLVPFYWLAVSWAGMIGLYQLIVKPHYWEKTIHGLHLIKAQEKLKEKTSSIAPVAIIEQPNNEIEIDVASEKVQYSSRIRALIAQKKIVLGGSIFVVALAAANFINFGFNAYLGRALDVEDFGVLTFFSSLLFLTSIPINAFGTVITQKVAFIFGRHSKQSAKGYLEYLNGRVIFTAGLFTIAWVLMIPFLKNYFNLDSALPLVFFTPVWLVSLTGAMYGGYLKGVLSFGSLASMALIEALSKFMLAALLIRTGFDDLVYLAIIGSTAFSLLVSFTLSSRDKALPLDHAEAKFNTPFYISALLNNLSSIAFLGLDVILVKHFLTATEAGEYALLSLAGKMVFFFGSLLSPLMLPLVARNQGAKKDSEGTFVALFILTVTMTCLAALPLVIFGNIIMPFLFGAKVNPILGFLPIYTVMIVMFAISQPIINYFQAKENHLFVVVSFFIAITQIILMNFFHRDISEIILIMFGISIANLLILTTLFALRKKLWVVSNVTNDFLDMFSPLKGKQSMDYSPNGKLRILILNWRDTKHVWAGGAEAYIHEVAKRWVSDGHKVTLFCGNDGKNPRNEVVEGIQIVRRGGFYTVYVWAFLYYVSKFRGLFDVVVDSENGLPFFTPLFVRVPKFLLIHHIHQEVFRNHLPFPLSIIAQFLEAKMMPLVYYKQSIITVSESSKKEILKLNLGNAETIQVVHPGVDPSQYSFSKKTLNPTFLYLGRLKAYKNIDVAIKAFKQISAEFPDATFTIAGFGEGLKKLKKLVTTLELEEKVEFLGKVTDEQKNKLLSSHWVFIQPSMLEGWGITVIEANASGTTVIASDVNGLKDSVVQNVTGVLVKAKDVDGFATAMKDLISDDKLRNKLSKDAYTWSKKFDWNNSAKNFYAIMEEKIFWRNSTPLKGVALANRK